VQVSQSCRQSGPSTAGSTQGNSVVAFGRVVDLRSEVEVVGVRNACPFFSKARTVEAIVTATLSFWSRIKI
jgi:hypothetical protein